MLNEYMYFLQELLFSFLFISLIIYFFKNRKIYSYVRGFFITFLIFRIMVPIFTILYLTISPDIFSFVVDFQFLRNYFHLTSSFLLLFGISLLIGKEYTIKNESKEYPTMEGTRRNIGITLLLFIITLGIHVPFWLYRTVKDLKTNFEDDIPYTPGKAVGFLFIPLFNIFWGFYIWFSLPSRIKKIENKYYGENVGFYFHPILISIFIFGFQTLLCLESYGDSAFEKSTFDNILFYVSAILVLYLTIQAKLNSFYDFIKESNVSK